MFVKSSFAQMKRASFCVRIVGCHVEYIIHGEQMEWK